MKITWNENPLMTTIELDEHEKTELWYKTKVEQMEWLLHGAHFHLTEDKPYFDLERAKQECDPEYYIADRGEKSKLDERVDMIVKEYIEALKGPHVGDCTCVACSCDKCHAEDLLGINTIPGLGKHEAVKIHSAFGEYMRPWKRKRNIDQVIEYLENYEPKADWDGWEAHAGRWKAEAKDACEWLKNYKIEHVNAVEKSA